MTAPMHDAKTLAARLREDAKIDDAMANGAWSEERCAKDSRWQAARVLESAEAKLSALQEEVGRLRLAADHISPYLRWTISEESPGHHPTMPSAVAAFHCSFDIETAEKRIARARSALARTAGGKDDG